MSKLVVEVGYCRYCKKTFRMLVYTPKDKLEKKDLKKLNAENIITIKKGDDIACPHCKEVLCKS